MLLGLAAAVAHSLTRKETPMSSHSKSAYGTFKGICCFFLVATVHKP